jgi:hypothetical protein
MTALSCLLSPEHAHWLANLNRSSTTFNFQKPSCGTIIVRPSRAGGSRYLTSVYRSLHGGRLAHLQTVNAAFCLNNTVCLGQNLARFAQIAAFWSRPMELIFGASLASGPSNRYRLLWL